MHFMSNLNEIKHTSSNQDIIYSCQVLWLCIEGKIREIGIFDEHHFCLLTQDEAIY
jgi:hypothetical protein